ncbi:MAG TPA: protein kinase [Polyangium sp.]|nr:protein kinase [Polyangium sp.]
MTSFENAPPSRSDTFEESALAETALADTQAAAPADIASTASASAQPGVLIKHYEIIRKLGQGGMGAVFLARDTRLGRRVAIKFLHEQSEPAQERFLVEARATALCQHENIVVIHDVDEFDGYPYMVLEYVEGRTLFAAMQERRQAEGPTATLDIHWIIDLMIPVTRALSAAHAMNIVHRDLKPENVLLSNGGIIKVVDFGIAKQLDTPMLPTTALAQIEDIGRFDLTAAGATPGTLMYMAPEQWIAADIDGRTDIWAVGLILFEMLVREHPLAPVSMATLAQTAILELPMPSAKEKRPDAAGLCDVIDRCLKKRKEERYATADELRAALEALSEHERNPARAEYDCPFAGLSAFQETDAGRYFGREQDIAAVIGQLRNRELVAITGPSGAGKSSFVRAGVIPALKTTGQRVETCVIRPGRKPLAALVEALSFLMDTTDGEERIEPAAIERQLLEQPGYLGVLLRARCRRRGSDHRVLLFVDQFEELYTLGIEPQNRAAFCASLLGVADDASSPLRVILSIRADFLDRLAEDRTFLSQVTRGLYFLPPMSGGGLRDALKKPVEAAKYQFEDEQLIDEISSGLAEMKSPLPILQFMATKLWEARDEKRRLLTREAYQNLGGVVGALSTHADGVLASMTSAEQRMTRAIFMRLVTPERTRAIVLFEELGELGEDKTAVELVVQRLADARLLAIESGDDHAGKTVELVHESLIERWGKLRSWLEENKHDAQFVAELRNAAAQWEKNDRAEGLLWRDRAAIEAGRWLERNKAEAGKEGALGIGQRELFYLQTVVRLSERTRRRRRQAIGAVIAFLGLFALSVSVLGLHARNQAKRADANASEAGKNAQDAEKSAQDAHKKAADARNASRMASAREHLSDPTLVLSLVRELEPTNSLPSRWGELARWATFQSITNVVLHHQDAVYFASFSPDGQRIVTACNDMTARVWNADGTGEPVILAGHQDIVVSASFSPEGRRIVTASYDKTVRVWNADGTGEPLILAGHQDRVNSASFSPDGARILTASRDRTARVWNADGKGTPLILAGHQDRVNFASFSADGARIVTASHDKTARVWNADGQGTPVVLAGHQDRVNSASFSRDGRRIVTASDDKTVRVWNANGHGEPLILKGHQDPAYSASFSPDGARIVSASWDNTARVWNADGKGTPVILDGHQDLVYSASFSSDGRYIVTASLDKTARLWNAESTRAPVYLHGHRDRVISASYSPDGAHIVTASRDKTARVWNVDGTEEPLTLEGHQDLVACASFSPDGRRIVTASWDKTARVWNADGTGTPLILRGHQDVVNAAAFSPDGAHIVTASTDKTARVWNADGTGEPVILKGHDELVYSASYSPDGARIVTGSRDKTARVWNADGTGSPLVLRGHQDVVYTASFSPDSRRIVTTSWDKTARVWNADGTGTPLIFRGHTAALAAGGHDGTGAFTPDGQRIVTISDDKTLRVWNADGIGEPAILRMPDSDAASAAFSPDGKHIVTVSHSQLDPTTGKTTYWATVWPSFEPLKSPNDDELWLATRYCPSVELRVELLGVSEQEAAEQVTTCQARVARAFERNSTQH